MEQTHLPQGPVEANLRHELRTPLNHIVSYSELLMEEMTDLGQPGYAADLGKIRSAAWSLLSLIEQHLGSTLPPIQERPEPLASEPPIETSLVETARLLIVDDNEPNRESLARRLTHRGYEVCTAAGGRAALGLLEGTAVDLVLLDVLMPDISGLAVLQMLRTRHTVAELPVIMVTALDQSEDTVLALRLGANDYVTKPLDFFVVLARIETQLTLKRARREIEHLASQLEARNAFIRAAFGRYVSEAVADSLLDSPDGLRLGGERREVTLLMADLRGFTSLTQWLPPEDVVRILNRYLGRMAEVVGQFDGTIDEFIGDAVLAFFGAPLGRADDAQRAVACAVAMQQAMEAINEVNAADGLPRVDMGIAVHTGEVVVGNIGSDRRAKYGAVGSAVNLTARMESCTVGGQVLVSRAALDGAGPEVRVDGQIMLQAKGFEGALEVYNLRGIGTPYDLFLPRRKIVVRVLEREVRARCWAVAGKQVEADGFDARILRLSSEEADLDVPPLDPLTNLRLRIVGFDGEDVPGDVYAKVLGRVPDETLHRVRFTAVPPEAERFLKLVCAVAAQKQRPDVALSQHEGEIA